MVKSSVNAFREAVTTAAVFVSKRPGDFRSCGDHVRMGSVDVRLVKSGCIDHQKRGYPYNHERHFLAILHPCDSLMAS
jgi:hypothetical protein